MIIALNNNSLCVCDIEKAEIIITIPLPFELFACRTNHEKKKIPHGEIKLKVIGHLRS